jgi:hypothetical protein
LALANDLNISLVALSFFAPEFESVRLSVLELAAGCGVERPDAFSSGVAVSLALALVVVAGLAAGFSAGLDAGFAEGFELAAVGGAYFAVLL